MLVPQLSSCTQDELDQVRAYVDAGRPALLTVDPMPLFDIRLAPREMKLPPPGQQNNMFGAQPPGEPKGDYRGLLHDFGVDWADDEVVYDRTNPNPVFAGIQPQIIFAHRADGLEFDGIDPTVDGLSQVAFLYPGSLKPASEYQGDRWTTLLSTTTNSGVNPFDHFVERHELFGMQGPVPPRTLGETSAEQYVLAARIKGGATTQGEGGDEGGHADQLDRPVGPRPVRGPVLPDARPRR